MSARSNRRPAPEVCPVCGEDVPRDALACPGCGADHNSGWREDAAAYDALDLPGEEFDYEEFARNEFGWRAGRPQIRLLWFVTAAILFAALVALALLGL